MRRLASIVAAMLLAGIAAFQLALILGAPWGRFTQGGGTPGALPAGGRVLAAISILILIVLWLAVSGRAGWGPARGWRPRLLAGLCWVAAIYSLLAIVLNAATPSGEERALWLPVSIVLALCIWLVAWPTRR